MGSSNLEGFADLTKIGATLFGHLKSGATGVAYFLGEDFGKAVAAGFMK